MNNLAVSLACTQVLRDGQEGRLPDVAFSALPMRQDLLLFVIYARGIQHGTRIGHVSRIDPDRRREGA